MSSTKRDDAPAKRRTIAKITEGKPQSDAFRAYVDGSSLGNPGPCGWACRINRPDGSCILKGGSDWHGTNNQMELKATIEALEAIPEDACGPIISDSQYVVHGATKWLKGWGRRGWRTSGGEPVANSDMWQELKELYARRPGVRFEWIKGHTGNQFNKAVDKLARAEAEKAAIGTPSTEWIMEFDPTPASR